MTLNLSNHQPVEPPILEPLTSDRALRRAPRCVAEHSTSSFSLFIVVICTVRCALTCHCRAILMDHPPHSTVLARERYTLDINHLDSFQVLRSHCKVPIAAPPPLNALPSPFLILSPTDTHLRHPTGPCEVGHTLPSIEAWVRRQVNVYRCVGSHYRLKGAPEPLRKSWEQRWTPSKENILRRN